MASEATISEVTSPEGGATRERGLPKTRDGIVVSNKMNKTIVVSIVRLTRHRQVKKFIRETKRYHVHDENQVANVGDTVRIVETRPMSKMKRWRLQSVLVKAE